MKVRNLIEGADVEVGLVRYGPRVRLVSAADNLEQSRFPGPICADETDFFRRIDLKGNVSKYILRTECLRDAVELYQH